MYRLTLRNKVASFQDETINVSMWQRGEITVMKNLPSFVPRTLVQQYARSEVRVQRRT